MKITSSTKLLYVLPTQDRAEIGEDITTIKELRIHNSHLRRFREELSYKVEFYSKEFLAGETWSNPLQARNHTCPWVSHSKCTLSLCIL